MHEVGLNVPPEFPSLHDTVPVGIEELGFPATLTVNATWDPWFAVAGFGVMVMVVPCCGFTVRDDVPVLPECMLSPLYAAVTITEF